MRIPLAGGGRQPVADTVGELNGTTFDMRPAIEHTRARMGTLVAVDVLNRKSAAPVDGAQHIANVCLQCQEIGSYRFDIGCRGHASAYPFYGGCKH